MKEKVEDLVFQLRIKMFDTETLPPMPNPLDDSRFVLVPSGRFRERFGPFGREAEFSNKKVCLVATDPAFLVETLYGISRRADCYYVKYGTIARDGMYLGRCMFASDHAAAELCQVLKGHPRLMASLQDDAWFEKFRDEPVPSGSCGVWDDWEEHAEQVSAVIESAFGRSDEANIVAAIRAVGAATISLVAQVPPEIHHHEPWPIVGHILFSGVTTDDNGGARGLGLAPLAVEPAFQGKGFGSRLVQVGLDRARLLGYDYVVVVGSPAYYSRFGFVPASQFGLSYEAVAPEHFMALELLPGALSCTSGVAHYHPAFDEIAAPNSSSVGL